MEWALWDAARTLLTLTRASLSGFCTLAHAALLLPESRLPPVLPPLLTPYPPLPQRWRPPSFLRSLLRGKQSQLLFYPCQTSSHFRQPPCPKSEARRPSLGQGPTQCPAPPPISPVFPLCGGRVPGGLVSQAAQRLFSNHYSGISVLQGGEAAAACPAKDLAVDKTFERGEGYL